MLSIEAIMGMIATEASGAGCPRYHFGREVRGERVPERYEDCCRDDRPFQEGSPLESAGNKGDRSKQE